MLVFQADPFYLLRTEEQPETHFPAPRGVRNQAGLAALHSLGEQKERGRRVGLVHGERDAQCQHGRQPGPVAVFIKTADPHRPAPYLNLDPLALEADGGEVSAEEVDSGGDQAPGQPQVSA